MELLILSKRGRVVRCSLEDFRTTGRYVQGVRGILLNSGDEVAGQTIIKDTDKEVVLVSKNGLVVNTELSGIRKIGRGGQGVMVGKLMEGDEWVSASIV